jgi:hypothetical protein
MAMMDRIKERIQRLGLSPRVTFETSPHLEEKWVRVSFGFRTREEFRKIVGSLSEADKRGEIDRLLVDLFGCPSERAGDEFRSPSPAGGGPAPPSADRRGEAPARRSIRRKK